MDVLTTAQNSLILYSTVLKHSLKNYPDSFRISNKNPRIPVFRLQIFKFKWHLKKKGELNLGESLNFLKARRHHESPERERVIHTIQSKSKTVTQSPPVNEWECRETNQDWAVSLARANQSILRRFTSD